MSVFIQAFNSLFSFGTLDGNISFLDEKREDENRTHCIFIYYHNAPHNDISNDITDILILYLVHGLQRAYIPS